MESENQVSRDNNMGQNMDLVTSRSGQLTDPSSTDRSAKSWNCCKLKLPSLRALITLTACFMLELAVGVSYTMGNMMPYVTSYLRNVTRETSLDYSTALWAGNTSWIVNSISMMFLGLLEHCMPYKVFLMLGIFFFAGSLIGSYWAVQTSFVAYVIVYGPFQGLAQGILWPSGIKVALKWFPERKRFIGALIMAGYGAGAFGWNQMVTQWINPDNLQPDLTVGEDVYFSQPEVLSNVPSCYLLLGGVLSGIQLLCILSFTFPPPSHTDTQEKSTRILVAVEEEAIKTSDPPSLDDVRSPTGGDDHSDKNGDMSVSDVDPEKSDSATSTPDYRPLQVLKSRMTWTLWLIKMSTGLGFVFIWDFYKVT
ncbi:hypothetical protein BaRGS_00009487 [Batillaria attramentaria]|uniref:Uncharacterized protein n=1 Tax=Batillaria attramentaria TaxID=370345 RepID=A0ABD0LJQ3_9CAEN